MNYSTDTWTPFKSPDFLGNYMKENPIRNNKNRTKYNQVASNKVSQTVSVKSINNLFNFPNKITLTPEQLVNYQHHINQYYIQKRHIQFRMYKNMLRQQIAMQHYIQQHYIQSQNYNTLFFNKWYF